MELKDHNAYSAIYILFVNANLKPSRLNELFNNRHGQFDRSCALSKLGFVPVEKHLLQASYEVALLCAKKKNAHTIVVKFVKF